MLDLSAARRWTRAQVLRVSALVLAPWLVCSAAGGVLVGVTNASASAVAETGQDGLGAGLAGLLLGLLAMGAVWLGGMAAIARLLLPQGRRLTGFGFLVAVGAGTAVLGGAVAAVVPVPVWLLLPAALSATCVLVATRDSGFED